MLQKYEKSFEDVCGPGFCGPSPILDLKNMLYERQWYYIQKHFIKFDQLTPLC